MMILAKKIGTLIITLFFISVFTFAAFQVIPGDQVSSSLGTNATKEMIEQAREEAGLNKSLPHRYGIWLVHVLRGDFGISSQYKVPVQELIGERFLITFVLTTMSMTIILVIAFPLGILAAKKEGKMLDILIELLSQLCMAVPPFFLGIMLTLLFGFLLNWFQVGGYVSPTEDFSGFIRFLIAPALSIAIPKAAMVIRFLRTSILRQMPLQYVRTAKSKGLYGNQILYGHVLQNALIPVVTFIGSTAAEVLAGTIVVEQVFNLPGLGRLLVTAISNRDYAVVQAAVLFIAAIVVTINYLVDAVNQYIDPRIRI